MPKSCHTEQIFHTCFVVLFEKSRNIAVQINTALCLNFCRRRMTIQDSLHHPWIKVDLSTCIYTKPKQKLKPTVKGFDWLLLVEANDAFPDVSLTSDSHPLLCLFAAKRHPAGAEPQGVGRQHGKVQEVCSSKEMEGKLGAQWGGECWWGDPSFFARALGR